jgi:hypothetical protein
MNDPIERSEAEWQADLDRSERELAAGQTVSMAVELAELDESIRRLEAKRKRAQKRKAAAGR